MGSAGGVSSACPGSKPEAKKFDFGTEADLWEVKAIEGRVASKTASVLSSTRNRGDSGMSMALTIDTADKDGADGKQWFYGVKSVASLFPYLEKGRTISLWVWMPEDAKVASASLVLRSIPAQTPEWTDMSLAGVTRGQWSQISLVVPPGYDCTKASPFGHSELGLFFIVGAGETYKGTIYVGDLEISAKP